MEMELRVQSRGSTEAVHPEFVPAAAYVMCLWRYLRCDSASERFHIESQPFLLLDLAVSYDRRNKLSTVFGSNMSSCERETTVDCERDINSNAT